MWPVAGGQQGIDHCVGDPVGDLVLW